MPAKVRIPVARALPLERLDALLDTLWKHRLGLIVAPAGSGKSTLMARFAARTDAPVAWYRAEAWDRETPAMLRHLETALAGALDGLARGWETIEDGAQALEAWAGDRALLVIDDLHTLEGTPAEAGLSRLLDYAPPSLRVLAGTRVPPLLNLSRMRVAEELLEIGGDQLRFRSWEVERLFRDFYREALPPEELAHLARRTEGWAAGLQLFHLATRGKPPDERRRVLGSLGGSSRVMREYLTRNVLDGLSEELRAFLIATSVLGRLSGPLCDRLLGRTGSARVLDELERRAIFTSRSTDDGTFRYHEVLRSHLQRVLIDESGEVQARAAHRSAGELLLDAGAVPEALEAFCKGEAWDHVARILGREGEQVAHRPSVWIDAIPASILRHDPWLTLASARRLRAEGRLAAALEAYARAETSFGATDAALACRAERRALAQWTEIPTTPQRDAWGILRSALMREPLAARRDAAALDGASGRLVEGLALMVAGQVRDARRVLLAAADDPDGAGPAASAAALGAGICALLSGDARGALEVEGAVDAAEALGLDWLARVGRASLALTRREDALQEAMAVASGCAGSGDGWGLALATLLTGWARVSCDEAPVETLEEAASVARAVGAPVLETWSRGLLALALARAGDPDARLAALQAESLTRSTGVPAARILPYLAFGVLDRKAEREYREVCDALRDETGLAIADHSAESPAEVDVERARRSLDRAIGSEPPLRMRTLGSFELSIEGRAIDLANIRPRVRMLLRLLASRPGARVHHEILQEALWPEADPATGSRNLHVAIAALRRAVEPGAGRGGFQLILREGDAYLLAVPPGSDVDALRFEEAVASGRAARDHGDAGTAGRWFREALDLYAGDLLAEDGPADWVIVPRERCRQAAVDAALGLAGLHRDADDADGVVRACMDGLRIDRYHDPFWRLLIDARDAAGDHAAASRTRQGYRNMLAELGVEAAQLTGSAR